MNSEVREDEAGSQPATDVNPDGDSPNDGPSSDPSDGGDKESLLDVARDVVSKKDDDPKTPEREDAGSPAADGGEGDGGADSENFEDVPFHKHPRFQQVIGQRNEAKQLVTERDAEIARLKPQAESYGRVEGFLRENFLTAEQGQQALEVAALLQNDPVRAFERLKPIVDGLAPYAGAGVFPEYEEAIKTGNMSRDMAVKLTRQRVNEKRQTFERDQDHLRRTRTADDQAQANQRMVTALNAWGAEKAGSDPSFAAKQKLFLASVQAHVAREGAPKTEQEAVTLANKVYDDLSQELQQFGPGKSTRQRKPTRMASGGTPTGAPESKPQTAFEAAKGAIAKTRSA